MNITNTATKHGSKLAAALVAAVFGSPCTTHAQNLVPNPGFEEADTCTTMDFGVHGPLQWHSANGTPDHLQDCLP